VLPRDRHLFTGAETRRLFLTASRCLSFCTGTVKRRVSQRQTSDRRRGVGRGMSFSRTPARPLWGKEGRLRFRLRRSEEEILVDAAACAEERVGVDCCCVAPWV